MSMRLCEKKTISLRFFQEKTFSHVDIWRKKRYNIVTMEKYEYKQEFQIKYCDVDFKDEIKPSTALALMEEVACASAEELGFGYAYVKGKGVAFMVSNVCVECLQPIALGARIVAKTWPLPPSYVVFGREYRFCNAQGETLLNASSRWCLVDMATGKLTQSKAIEGQDYSTYNTDKAIEDVKWKLPTFEEKEGALSFSMTVANSEYDHNLHVNNTRYADYCFNCFSIEELSMRKLKRFALTYVRQAHEGDVLRFYRKRAEDGSYLVQGHKRNGELVVQAQIIFDEDEKGA